MVIALLLVITFAALAATAGLLTYVLRLTREERDRSEARAAALAEALAATASPQPATSPMERAKPEPQNQGAAPIASAFAAVADAPDAPEAPASGFPRALLIPAIGVFVVGVIAALVFGVAAVRSRAGAQGQSVAESAAAPLELVALRHERQGDGLVISGVVRNPQEGRTVSGLAAVAFLFDSQGNLLTSRRSPLDDTQLQPGEESPFSIAVPSAAAVGRYRITFRTDAAIVPHVDRRTDPPVVPAASR